LQLQMSTEL